MTRLLSRQLVFMHAFELLSLHMLAGKSVTYIHLERPSALMD